MRRNTYVTSALVRSVHTSVKVGQVTHLHPVQGNEAGTPAPHSQHSSPEYRPALSNSWSRARTPSLNHVQTSTEFCLDAAQGRQPSRVLQFRGRKGMAALIQKIGRLAIKTFRRDPGLTPTSSKNHYDLLCDLLACLTPSDLHLESALLQDRGVFNAGRDGAPVTYMQIYEDHDLTICVFILKRGVRLPLHDHPGMCGLLKVVHGAVSVQSYTLLRDSETQGRNAPTHKALGDHNHISYPPHHVLPATKHPEVVATADNPACRLNPGDNNVHEIHALDGPAAFLDILSPPYGNDARLGLERDCHYYREVGGGVGGGGDGGKVLLCQVETPVDFWCDQAEYKGPLVCEDDTTEMLLRRGNHVK
ncbi:2-aminoethanethiol dioxygenase [Chionoecetes opilio]|uniref:2-aminoethanethiol dioxygenase n=1 Tax=Chionoecetes opilio TaxID=41210 RepID=A0A8J8WB71_CHIOP|nr:2-aminoethanethiol dioxygenase [Chionoecetes opilio]